MWRDQWIGWGGTKEYEEEVSVGIQTFDKVLMMLLSGKAIARRLMRLSLQMVYL